MKSELASENLLEMVRAYAAITTYLPQYPELATQIVAAYNAAAVEPVTFEGISKILRAKSGSKEAVSRRVAWLSQHILHNQARCVSYPIVQHRDQPINGEIDRQYHSPIVEQVATSLGLEAEPVNYNNFMPLFDNSHFVNRIDAVVVDVADEITVYCVKGCLASQLPSGHLQMAAPVATQQLFSCWDENLKQVPQVKVPSQHIRALILASWILGSAFKGLRIVPVYVVVDDPDAGWNFQAHRLDFAKPCLQDVRGSSFDVSPYPVLESSVAYTVQGIDVSLLERVPEIPVKNPLSSLPVDRATRCNMLLNVVWASQACSERLEAITVSALRERTEELYLISYPVDLLRHDLEDCLERQNLLMRPHEPTKAYALTPESVAHILLLRRQFARDRTAMNYSDADSNILAPVRKQAALWARHKQGINVTE